MSEPIPAASNFDAKSQTPRSAEGREAAVAEASHEPHPGLLPDRQCTCGGVLSFVPPPPRRRHRRRHRSRARAVPEEFFYYCRHCKRQVMIPSVRLQIRHCATLIISSALVCLLALQLFKEMRRRSSLPVMGTTAVAFGLCFWIARVSQRCLLRGLRNQRRYPLNLPQA